MDRRIWSIGVIGILALAWMPMSAKAAYPERPVRLIVPTVPGTPPDMVARLIGTELAAALGQPVVVENRPGAIGTIGLGIVAQAAPDGYTLGVLAMPYVVAPYLLDKIAYATEKDLAPVTLINWSYPLLAVPARSAARSLDDLVQLAKTHPGGLKYSSNGNGTPPHLAAELFKREAGIDIMHVPYKGSVAGVTALLSGDVDLTFGTTAVLAPHIGAGKLRAIATAAPQRLPAFPDIPALVELGFTNLVVRDWQGIVAPSGTAAAVIERLDAEIQKILAKPETKERFRAMGMEAAGIGSHEFSVHIQREMQRWGTLVRDARIVAD